MHSRDPLPFWALSFLTTATFTSAQGSSFQERSDFQSESTFSYIQVAKFTMTGVYCIYRGARSYGYVFAFSGSTAVQSSPVVMKLANAVAILLELPYNALGPAVYSAAYVAALGSSSAAAITSLIDQTFTAATLSSTPYSASTNDKTSSTTSVSSSANFDESSFSPPLITSTGVPAQYMSISTPARDVTLSSSAELSANDQTTSTAMSSRDGTSSEPSTSSTDDGKPSSSVTASSYSMLAEDQTSITPSPSDSKSPGKSQTSATTDTISSTPGSRVHPDSTIITSSSETTTGATTLGSMYSMSPISEPTSTPSVDVSTLLRESSIVLGPTSTISELAGSPTSLLYDTTSSSLIPVWTPAMLGNAYGGGYVITPSLYVTNSSTATSAINMFPQTGSTAGGSLASAVGVPPGYGFTVQIGPSQSYVNGSVPIVIAGLGSTATYFRPNNTTVPATVSYSTADIANPALSTKDELNASGSFASTANGGSDQFPGAPGMSQSAGGSSNASINIPAQPTATFMFQGLASKITLTFAGGVVGFLALVFIL